MRPDGSRALCAERAQRHLHGDEGQEHGEQHVAAERVDERRDPRAERRRRAGGNADQRGGDEVDVARRTLPIVPETAVGIIMSSEVPLATRSLVPNSSMSAGNDDDPAADAEETRERSR